MNSSKLYYHVFQSSKSVHEVLNDYDRAMVPRDLHTVSPSRFGASMDVSKFIPNLPFLEFLANRSRVVRDESTNWGYLSYLDLGAEANQDWHVQFKSKMVAFAKSKRLGDLGTARTVVRSLTLPPSPRP